MSQRNPLNDRYTVEDKKANVTRKSAASAKPKAAAGATVHVQRTEKTRKEKKQARRLEEAKQAERDRKYATPPTAEFKRLKKFWWFCLIVGIVLVGVYLLVASNPAFPEMFSMGVMAVAYVFILVALYLEFFKMRKIRSAWQEEVRSLKGKEIRRIEREAKAAEEKRLAEEGPKPEELKGIGRLFAADSAKKNKKAEKEAEEASK